MPPHNWIRKSSAVNYTYLPFQGRRKGWLEEWAIYICICYSFQIWVFFKSVFHVLCNIIHTKYCVLSISHILWMKKRGSGSLVNFFKFTHPVSSRARIEATFSIPRNHALITTPPEEGECSWALERDDGHGLVEITKEGFIFKYRSGNQPITQKTGSQLACFE